MKELKFALFAAVAVSALSLATGCTFVSEEHRGGHERTVVSGHLTVVVDEVTVERYGPVDVYIDGRFYGHLTRSTELSISAGEHHFVFERRGFAPYSERIVIVGGRPAHVRPEFRERGRGRR